MQSLERLFEKCKLMMRYELLPFLPLTEIAKLSLLNKKMNGLVDPNRPYVKTQNYQIITNTSKGTLETHLTHVVVSQLKLGDI